MKFARYLEETQTPEWKKAYIDYRGLKKRITAIRRSQKAARISDSTDALVLSPTAERVSEDSANAPGGAGPSRPSHEAISSATGPAGPSSLVQPGDHPVTLRSSWEDQNVRSHSELDLTRGEPAHPVASRVEVQSAASASPEARSKHLRVAAVESATLGRKRSATIASAFRAFPFPRPNSTRGTTNGIAGGPGGPRFDVRRPIPLMELLPLLTPVERAFFERLDAELDKVESFYSQREKEMRHRANLLKEQLQELKDHRRAFYDAHPAAAAPYSWLPLPLPLPPPTIPNALLRRRKATQDHHPPASPPQPHQHELSPHAFPPVPERAAKSWRSSFTHKHPDSPASPSVGIPKAHIQIKDSATGSVDGEPNSDETDATLAVPSSGPATPPASQPWKSRTAGISKSVQAILPPGLRPVPSVTKNVTATSDGTDAGAEADNEDEPRAAGEGSGSGKGKESPAHAKDGAARYDPEEYQHAKKQLKKAVLECYRGLELLSNYRTLNLIGFRKALKKFEKITGISAQIAYTKEKIEPSAFSSGAVLDDLIADMEALFAARFARGDKKRAMARLRGGAKPTSHHFSTFCTGMALGLAVPALAAGLYQSFQSDTRADIPGWDGLMYVYAVFFVPTFFSLLVGVNLLVWAQARINYVFIFELDVRTKMDHRVYFELPAFLLSLLCYAFWLSFSLIGADRVAPTTWPLLWLLFAIMVVFNPLPIVSKPSRWWLLRNVARLLTSGVHRVEFADFWMGDQFCSLLFTLGNLYFVACAYATGIDAGWRRCTTNHGPKWGVAFLLAVLPLSARLVQSIKRYADSGLGTHLINGGKYGSGVVQVLLYYLWRSQGGTRGAMFVAWCIFATNYSIYAGAWDLLMDWSLLQPHAPYPLLRKELLYHNAIPFYYFAIVSNTLIRFIWVIYIPERGPNFIIRTFIAAMLEILRRWQWNVLRLENEHLGNIDQYRVTREVPLPYSYDDHSQDSDGDEEEDGKTHRSVASSRSWRDPRRNRTLETDAITAEHGAVSDS